MRSSVDCAIETAVKEMAAAKRSEDGQQEKHPPLEAARAMLNRVSSNLHFQSSVATCWVYISLRSSSGFVSTSE
ncbi:hypothetical protein PZA11_000755 [Diplocarpon coronariae]